MARETITILAGTLNEAGHLPGFLKKHAWVDEIVILDSGSTDGSVDICRQAGCRVIPRDHKGNHNERICYALSQLKTDWVFLIDPDEYITDSLREEIFVILEKGTVHAAFRNVRLNYFMGKPLHYGGVSGEQLKFFRRDKAGMVGRGYHEEIQVNGTIGRLKGEVYHFPFDNIHWMVAKFNYMSELDKDRYFEKFKVMSEKTFFWFVIVSPLKIFLKTMLKKQGYRDGVPGLVFALMSWVYNVLKICKYWEAYMVCNPDVIKKENVPDPWRTRR